MKPKDFFKKILPHPSKVREHHGLKHFGDLLHHPNLWHVNRRSTSGAVAVGVFLAFMPVPFQMPLAALIAILIHVNLPLAVCMVWVTNPLTMVPIFYVSYQVGTALLGLEPQPLDFQLSLDWIFTELTQVWQPFLLGCVVCGAIAALVGYVLVRVIWRIWVVLHWRSRSDKRNK